MRVFVSSLKPGYDLAFLAKKSILDKDRKTIEEEVRIGLTEADLLMENNDWFLPKTYFRGVKVPFRAGLPLFAHLQSVF